MLATVAVFCYNSFTLNKQEKLCKIITHKSLHAIAALCRSKLQTAQQDSIAEKNDYCIIDNCA